MKKNQTVFVMVMAMVALLLACVMPAAAGSYYATHATLAAVNVGPGSGARDVEFISAMATNVGAYVELLAGKPTSYRVATAQATAVTNVTLASVTGLAAGDKCLIVHATGAVDYRVVEHIDGSIVFFTTAPSAALTTAARIWELETAGRYYLPYIYSGTNTATKTMQPLQIGGKLYRAFGVPFRLEITGTNPVLSVTVGD